MEYARVWRFRLRCKCNEAEVKGRTPHSALTMTSEVKEVSPSVTPTPLSAPKFGTLIPNRIFVGGIAANTTEQELKQFFSNYGAVRDSKIIADRAGVSKGYGFITFESQEDADKIIKTEADNLIFKERKLNIGPAVRKQQNTARVYEPLTPDLVGTIPKDPSLPAGTLYFTNGVPYTYQNGMAVFHTTEGAYNVVQQQTPTYQTMMVPQTPTMYVTPQTYSAYQPATPQWTPTAAPATPWRWTQQSPQQAVTGSPGYYYTTLHSSPDLMYAQPPPHVLQPSEVTDAAAMVDSQALEGSLFHKSVDQSLLSTSTDATTTTAATVPPPSTTTNMATTSSLQLLPGTPAATATVAMAMPIPQQPPLSSGNAAPLTKPTYSSSTAPYPKKSVTAIPRRPFSSPTLLVKHGHKVQRVMMPAKAITPNGHMTYIRDDGIPSYSLVAPQPPPDTL